MIKLSDKIDILQDYLHTINWLDTDEKILSTGKPGDGNMNFTLRITTDARSFIVKQSRDYVEKYPEVAAPQNRILMEARFYELIHADSYLNFMSPDILHLDKENNIMIMADLGNAEDFTSIYKKREKINEGELEEITNYAAILHSTFNLKNRDFKSKIQQNIIRNRAMRVLNHEHIFLFPFVEENGLNLDDIMPGLAEIAEPFKKDTILKKKATELGEIYLADRDSLLHGDYFPGSWVKTEDGIFIIDPEFCFFGPMEFDIGVGLAHLQMADQDYETQVRFLTEATRGNDPDYDLVEKFAGIEVLRRVIGLAQLPLELSLQKRGKLLKVAACNIKK